MRKTSVKKLSAGIVILFGMLFPSLAFAGVIVKDTVWQGEIKVTEDILVPKGITLTIRPGTSIKVVAAESTKTDPEYMSPLTEITIRGRLLVEGNDKAPVEFSGEERKPGSWAGILVDKGSVTMQGCRIKNAETGVYVLGGKVVMEGALLQDNRYGLVAQGERAAVTGKDSRITENDYGILALQGAQVESRAVLVKGNRKRDKWSASVKVASPEMGLDNVSEIAVSREYRDEALLGDTVWQGRIEVSGTIRVPEGSRLIIMPGTIVEFRKKDTNGDGIGENGLLVQGRLVAKGTREHPIIFRSAEKDKEMGDWDAINIMNSAGTQNLIEYCRIEHAYRGLHFHFSNVTVHKSVLCNNYRGIQFQESLVVIKGSYLYGNKSGVQGRDSDITFADNFVGNNYMGGNFLRSNLMIRGNRVVGNWKEGLRIREGVATLQENLVDGNRYGLMVADTFYGDYSHNVITNNVEVGFFIKNVDNVEINGNFVAGNGINGLNVQESRALIRGNHISDNGERGMGILSFEGVITENNFAKNGLYAVELDGTKDVSAPLNWWGGDSPKSAIYDGKDDPAKGKVAYGRVAGSPFPFVWPVRLMQTDGTWLGVISVRNTVTVLPGATLRIAPGTRVEFSAGAGLAIKGKIIAAGTSDGKIIFTSTQKKGASDWDEILLEYAVGSVITHCVFEYATWGIHSHFTNLSVSDSHFAKNYGGMRFRSGPVEIRRSLFEDNYIGVRAYRGNAVISDNVITKNEIGIFVREKGGGLNITHNNLFGNLGYNIRVGDFNDEDVSAKGNWWGYGDPAGTIFDGRTEPGIGKVMYEPYLKEPVTTERR